MTEFDDNETPMLAEPEGEPTPAPSVSDTPQLPIDDVSTQEPEAIDEPLPEPEALEEPLPAPEPDVEPEPVDDAPAGPKPSREPEPEPVAPAPADAEAVPDAPDAALVEGVRGGLTWLPFALYLGLWVVLAGLSAYFLRGATPEGPARFMPEYEPLLWAGVGLTALGPALSLVVWLFARTRRPKGERRGLFASAVTRGALVTFFGVLIWLGTLFVLELLASGWTL